MTINIKTDVFGIPLLIVEDGDIVLEKELFLGDERKDIAAQLIEASIELLSDSEWLEMLVSKLGKDDILAILWQLLKEVKWD